MLLWERERKRRSRKNPFTGMARAENAFTARSKACWCGHLFFNCSVWAIQKTLVPDSHYFNVLEAAKTKYQKMMKQYATGIVTTAEMSR